MLAPLLPCDSPPFSVALATACADQQHHLDGDRGWRIVHIAGAATGTDCSLALCLVVAGKGAKQKPKPRHRGMET